MNHKYKKMDQVPNPIILEIYWFLDETSRVRFYMVCSKFRNLIREHYTNIVDRFGIQEFKRKCKESDILGACIMAEKLSEEIEDISEWIDSITYSESEKTKIRCLIIAIRNREFKFKYRILYEIMILDKTVCLTQLEDCFRKIWSEWISETSGIKPVATIHAFIKVSILFRNHRIIRLIFIILRRYCLTENIVKVKCNYLYNFIRNYKSVKSVPNQYLDTTDPFFWNEIFD